MAIKQQRQLQTFNALKLDNLIDKLEEDVLAFANEASRLYRIRCESIFDDCSQGNYHDCVSELPNAECMKGVQHRRDSCTESNEYSHCPGHGLFDFTASTIFLPASLVSGITQNPTDPEVIESICMTRGLDQYLIKKIEEDKADWKTEFDGFQPRAYYFGSTKGSFRIYPGVSGETCAADFDPRLRPWFVAASSGPKNIVMILDKSGSMERNDRISLLKDAVIRVINTLTVSDRVAIVTFDSVASLISDNGLMYKATTENKMTLIEAIKSTVVGNLTNFYDAFEAAFDVLDDSIREERSVSCNSALLFFTDGEMTFPSTNTSEVLSLVQNRIKQTQAYTDFPVYLFTYSVTEEGKDAHAFPRELACLVPNGVWSIIQNDEEIVDSLNSYYQLFALGLGDNSNKDFVAWVEPYEFVMYKSLGTTVSAPVYDRSRTPALFVGVVGIDMTIEAMNVALGLPKNETSGEVIDRVVRRSTAVCPRFNLSECLLEAFRYSGDAAAADALCTGSCDIDKFVNVFGKPCEGVSDYPSDLWANTKHLNVPFMDRVCCDSSNINDGMMEQCSLIEEGRSKWLIAGVSVSCIFFCIILYVAYLVVKKLRLKTRSPINEADFRPPPFNPEYSGKQ